jgi:hypothetical protein
MNVNYRVRFAPSLSACAFIALGGGATLVLLYVMPIDPLIKAFSVLWTGASMLDACRLIALRRGRGAARELVLRHPRAMEVFDDAELPSFGELRDGSFVAPWLTIIRWRPTGARFDRTIVILPDMLERESFRRLRVVLRWGTDHMFRG